MTSPRTCSRRVSMVSVIMACSLPDATAALPHTAAPSCPATVYARPAVLAGRVSASGHRLGLSCRPWTILGAASGSPRRSPFIQLDYLYTPSKDVEADARMFTEVLGGTLAFAV